MNEEKNKTLLIDDTLYETQYSVNYLRRKPYVKPNPKKISAFIPGQILKLYVKKGSTVKVGDKLMILEAMKMQNEVLSELNGTITNVAVREGDKVVKNQLLIEFE